MIARERLAAVLAATMLVASPVAAQELTPIGPGRYMVTGTSGLGLELRAGPGLDQPALGLLPEGTEVFVLDGPAPDSAMNWVPVLPPASLNLPNGYSSALFLAPVASESGAALLRGRVLQAMVTGYANGADGGSVGTMTSSGVKTHWGTLAADTRLFPFGTKLTIEGFDGVVFTVEDTGSAVHGAVFDVWFPDVPTSIAFGTQHRRVTILP